MPAAKQTLVAWLGVGDIAHALGVNESKVLNFIRSGELLAINVAQTAGRRPRWRIRPADFEMFALARSATPATPVTRRSRRKNADVIEFF